MTYNEAIELICDAAEVAAVKLRYQGYSHAANELALAIDVVTLALDDAG